MRLNISVHLCCLQNTPMFTKNFEFPVSYYKSPVHVKIELIIN